MPDRAAGDKMYIAICIMLCGLVLGRVTRHIDLFGHFGKLVFPSILLLLFLLGTGIGGNSKIMEALPKLGLSALMLTIAGMAGSIFCTWLITPFILKKTGRRQIKK